VALRLEGVQSELTNRVRPTLTVLMGAVVLLLVLACENVANLTLARASSRVREIAVRRALGATRGRLVRQLLVESLVVAIAGGGAALAALAWSKNWIVAMMPDDLPRLTEVHFDAGMIAIGLVLSIAAGWCSASCRRSGVGGQSRRQLKGRPGLGEGRRERRFGARSLPRRSRFRWFSSSAPVCWCAASEHAAGQSRTGGGPRHFAQIWILSRTILKESVRHAPQLTAYVNEVLRRVGELPGVESVG
jgi:hypothetical protein